MQMIQRNATGPRVPAPMTLAISNPSVPGWEEDQNTKRVKLC